MFTGCKCGIFACVCDGGVCTDLKKPHVIILFQTNNNKKTKGNRCDSENDNDGGNQDRNGGEY